MLETGTKVRIKYAETLMSENDVEMYDEIDIEDIFVENMWKYCGKEATITGIIENEKPYTSYRLQFDDRAYVDGYNWNEYMFEVVGKEKYDAINIEDILC